VRLGDHVAHGGGEVAAVETAIPHQVAAGGDVEQTGRVAEIEDAAVAVGQGLAVTPAFGWVMAGRAAVTGIAGQALVKEQQPAELGLGRVDLGCLGQGRKRRRPAFVRRLLSRCGRDHGDRAADNRRNQQSGPRSHHRASPSSLMATP